MIWKTEITKTAAKQLRKIGTVSQKRILSFIKEKLEGTQNPREYGKALKGEKSELWRYRIGDYRLICSLEDNTVTIIVLALGHRKTIYR